MSQETDPYRRHDGRRDEPRDSAADRDVSDLMGKKEEKYEEEAVIVSELEKNVLVCDEEEKKKQGLLDKIKEKLDVGKKAEEEAKTPPPTPAADQEEEQKGFLKKIKERISGVQPNLEEKEKKKDESACH